MAEDSDVRTEARDWLSRSSQPLIGWLRGWWVGGKQSQNPRRLLAAFPSQGGSLDCNCPPPPGESFMSTETAWVMEAQRMYPAERPWQGSLLTSSPSSELSSCHLGNIYNIWDFMLFYVTLCGWFAPRWLNCASMTVPPCCSSPIWQLLRFFLQPSQCYRN